MLRPQAMWRHDLPSVNPHSRSSPRACCRAGRAFQAATDRQSTGSPTGTRRPCRYSKAFASRIGFYVSDASSMVGATSASMSSGGSSSSVGVDRRATAGFRHGLPQWRACGAQLGARSTRKSVSPGEFLGRVFYRATRLAAPRPGSSNNRFRSWLRTI